MMNKGMEPIAIPRKFLERVADELSDERDSFIEDVMANLISDELFEEFMHFESGQDWNTEAMRRRDLIMETAMKHPKAEDHIYHAVYQIERELYG
jgi:hypothetical protein